MIGAALGGRRRAAARSAAVVVAVTSALSGAACSRYAVVHHAEGTTWQGTIECNRSGTVQLQRKHDDVYIEESDITEVDHPGSPQVIAGTILTGVGVTVGLLWGTAVCSGDYVLAEACALTLTIPVVLVGGPGVAMIADGVARKSESRRRLLRVEAPPRDTKPCPE